MQFSELKTLTRSEKQSPFTGASDSYEYGKTGVRWALFQALVNVRLLLRKAYKSRIAIKSMHKFTVRNRDKKCQDQAKMDN